MAVCASELCHVNIFLFVQHQLLIRPRTTELYKQIRLMEVQQQIAVQLLPQIAVQKSNKIFQPQMPLKQEG